jgi:hypothetical protein
MTSRVVRAEGSVRLSTSGAEKELPDTAPESQYSVTVTAIGGPRARHAVLLRGTLNSDDLFFVPHSRTARAEKKQLHDLLAFCNRNYHTVLNNGLMT